MTGDRDARSQSAKARRAGSPLRVLRAPPVPEPPPRPATPGRVGEDLRTAPGAQAGAASRRARTASRPRETLLPRLKRWQPAPGALRRGDTDARRRRVRERLGLAALLLVQAAFAGLVIWALTSPPWQVRYVQVEGTDDAALAAAIQALPLTGCNIFRCDTTHQTRLITRLPAVARAEVHAAYPDGLVVVVVPRRPALLWHIGGTGYVVATDGTVLGPQASDPAFAQAPLLDVVDTGAAAFGGRAPAPGQRMDAAVADMARQLRSGLAALGTGWTLRLDAAMDGRYGLRCAEGGRPAGALRHAGGRGPDRRGALQRWPCRHERGGGAAPRAARRAGAALQPWGACDADRSALGRASILS